MEEANFVQQKLVPKEECMASEDKAGEKKHDFKTQPNPLSCISRLGADWIW